MTYKIVFFDIDGTLLTKENKIPEETKRSVRLLQEKGVKTAIATGRSPYHLSAVANELGIDTFVSFNGSYVVNEGKVVFENPIGRDALHQLQEVAEKENHPMVYLSDEQCFASREAHPHVIESFQSLNLRPPGSDADYWKERNIYQAFLYCQEQEESIYTDVLTQVTHIRWHRVAMDIMPRNGSKARGIEALLSQLRISTDEAVAFGDGLNDKEMLSFVGMGVAMGNAHEELKPHAKMVTRSVDEDGIAYGLERLGLL